MKIILLIIKKLQIKFLSNILYLLLFTSYLSFSQTGYWTELNPDNPPPPRTSFDMAPIGEKKILIFGGLSKNDIDLNDTWIYDFNSNTWEMIYTSPVPHKRFNHQLAQVSENEVLLYGGEYNGRAFGDTWIFNLVDKKWRQVFPDRSPDTLIQHSMCPIGKNKVLLFGGIELTEYDLNFLQKTWIYDLDKNSWDIVTFNPITEPWPGIRSVGSLANINQKNALLFGGNFGGKELEDTWLFDLEIRKWIKIDSGKIKPMRRRYSVAGVNDKSVLLFGGYRPESSPPDYFNDIWIIDLDMKNWKEIIIFNPPTPRIQSKMTKISDNEVLLFGGRSTDNHLNDLWRLRIDPTSIDDKNLNSNTRIAVYQSQSNIEIRYNLKYISSINIKVYDFLGREVYAFNEHNKNPGVFKHSIPCRSLAKGMYIVVLKTNTELYTEKIIIQ